MPTICTADIAKTWRRQVKIVLIAPIGQQAGRGDHKNGPRRDYATIVRDRWEALEPSEKRKGLQCLSEAHIVREQYPVVTSNPGILQPIQTRDLMRL